MYENASEYTTSSKNFIFRDSEDRGLPRLHYHWVGNIPPARFAPPVTLILPNSQKGLCNTEVLSRIQKSVFIPLTFSLGIDDRLQNALWEGRSTPTKRVELQPQVKTNLEHSYDFWRSETVVELPHSHPKRTAINGRPTCVFSWLQFRPTVVNISKLQLRFGDFFMGVKFPLKMPGIYTA